MADADGPGVGSGPGAAQPALRGALAAPVVDAHAHIFSADMPLMAGAWTGLDYAFTAEDLLAALDAHGVHFAVISGLSIAGRYNDYMVDALRRHRRLRGTVILPPQTDRYTLERLNGDNVVGIRLQLARQAVLPDLGGDDWRLLIRRVRDLGWHVHLAIEGERLPLLLPALLESGVDLVIDHFGHPDPADPLRCAGYRAMIAAVETGRVWVKLAAGFRLPGPSAWRDDPEGDIETLAVRIAADLLARVGTGRLLWGSDAPFVGYERRVSYGFALACFERWVPDLAQRAEISRTALRLYFG